MNESGECMWGNRVGEFQSSSRVCGGPRRQHHRLEFGADVAEADTGISAEHRSNFSPRQSYSLCHSVRCNVATQSDGINRSYPVALERLVRSVEKLAGRSVFVLICSHFGLRIHHSWHSHSL